MDLTGHKLLLADDDTDDCIFFKEALEELPLTTTLTTVHNGVELMRLLQEKKGDLPDLLFLDLNMPRKTGYECLVEIKSDEDLKHLPVIIFSTSFDLSTVDTLFDGGAHHYIRKPAHFAALKEVIYKVLSFPAENFKHQPEKERFVLYSD